MRETISGLLARLDAEQFLRVHRSTIVRRELVKEFTHQQQGDLSEARSIIADVQRIVTPNGVDRTLTLTLGRAQQVVNIRGSDKRNPILIYIHGGPGSVEMPMAWTFQRPWEDFFTVVQWDQRGAGKAACWFENSGHLPMIEEPGHILSALIAIREGTKGPPGISTRAMDGSLCGA